VIDQPILQLIQHFQIIGQFRPAPEARCITMTCSILVHAPALRRRAAVTGLNKELLFMGK